ncbi:hypothetical protein IJJ08_02735 [bacterium]|nr:hypothetical protein [bacterium]
MSPYLVTEFPQALPQVLLLGDVPTALEQIATIFHERGFASQIYHWQSLTSAAARERLGQKNYYKIICLVELGGAQSDLSLIRSVLSGRREPILFITRFDSTVDVDNLQTRTWYQACRQQYQHIIALAEEFPRANLLIVRDLLVRDQAYHPGFEYIFRQLNSQVLTDPGINFFFISQTNFLQQITPQFFVPFTGEKYLFTAQAISSNRVFDHLDQITDHHYKIVMESYPPVDFAFPFALTALSGPADMDMLTSDYLQSFLLPQPTTQTVARPQKTYPVAATVKITPVPAKNKAKSKKNPTGKKTTVDQSASAVKLEPITLPPGMTLYEDKGLPKTVLSVKNADRKEKKPANKEKQSLDNAVKVALEATNDKLKKVSDRPHLKAKSARQILKAVRTTITAQEKTVLENYLDREKQVITRPPQCEYINLQGFNFYQCQLQPQAHVIVDIPLLQTAPSQETSTSTAQKNIDVTIKKSQKRQEIASKSTKGSSPSRSQGAKKTRSQEALDFTTKYFNQEITPEPGRIVTTMPLERPVAPKKTLAKGSVKKTGLKKRTRPLSTKAVIPAAGRSWQLPGGLVVPTPAMRRFYRRYLTNQIVAGSAVILAIMVVFIFFLVVQPRQNQEMITTALKAYFQECVDLNSCLGARALRHTSTFTLVKNNDYPDLVASILRLVSRRERLEGSLDTYFATAWQNQSGSVASELKILRQTLGLAQEELANAKRLFADARLSLHELTDDTHLNTFAISLNELESEFQLLNKYLSFLEAAANIDNLPITLVIMDNNVARTGGGLILGVANLTFEHGSYKGLEFLTTTQLINASNIKINSPHQLADIDSVETSGLHNLTFARDFNETAILLTQDLSGAMTFKPRLIVGVNLDTIADLERLLAGRLVNETLKNTAPAHTTSENEIALGSVLSELDLQINRLAATRGDEFVKLLLNNFDNQAFQFYSVSDTLKDAITSAGLRSDAASVRCPGGFGSSVCYLDTFVQNEDYLGSNTGLTRETTHEIVLASGLTRHHRTVVFTNNSPVQVVNDYLTFSLPLGATLESLTLDQEAVELDEDDALILTLAPGQSQTLEIGYRLDRTIANSDFTYSFYNQHQNGSPDQNLKVIIVSEVPYTPRIIAPTAVTSSDTITFGQPGAESFFGAVVY